MILLIRLLARTSAKGANLLLNIGPQPDGTLPEAALQRLSGMGEWLKCYGPSIYGTEAGGVGDGEKIVSTRKGKTLYLHVLDSGLTEVSVPLTEKVKSATDFRSRQKLKFRQKDGQLVIPVTVSGDVPDYVLELRLQ